MIIIDSSGWLHYFMNGDLAEPYSEYLTKRFGEIITPSIVLYEVYKKLRREVDEEMLEDCLSQLEKTNLVEFSPDLSYRAAELSLEHRLAMADSIIYATAEAYDAKLVTSDKDFKNLPSVEYISPEERTSDAF